MRLAHVVRPGGLREAERVVTADGAAACGVLVDGLCVPVASASASLVA